jgi:hypothetical protein
LPFVAGFGAAHAEEFAAVGGRHGDGEPLHGRPFFEDGTGPEPAGGSGQWLAQREREAGGEKRDEPVGPDALAPLMNDGPQAEGARERAERCFAKTPLPIAAPDQLRIVGAQVGAQPIAAFTTAPGAPFVTVQPIRESAVRRDLGLPPTRRAAAGFFRRGAELGEPRAAGQARPPESAEALPESSEAAAEPAAFFAGAGVALGEYVEFAGRREKSDAELRVHFPPRPLQRGRRCANRSSWCGRSRS